MMHTNAGRLFLVVALLGALALVACSCAPKDMKLIPREVLFGNPQKAAPKVSPDGAMLVFCRAPTTQGPWQICLKQLDGDDMDFVPLTTEGSNLSPDWHVIEE